VLGDQREATFLCIPEQISRSQAEIADREDVEGFHAGLQNYVHEA